MKAEDNEDAIATPMGEIDGGDPAEVAIGSDGAPVQDPLAPPLPSLAFTPENVPCLRNCRYYFRSVGHFDTSNPDRRFTSSVTACMRVPGVWLELSGDAPSYECNSWDPWRADELGIRDLNRQGYYDAHPDHVPTPLEERLNADAEVDIDEEDDDEDGSELALGGDKECPQEADEGDGGRPEEGTGGEPLADHPGDS